MYMGISPMIILFTWILACSVKHEVYCIDEPPALTGSFFGYTFLAATYC